MGDVGAGAGWGALEQLHLSIPGAVGCFSLFPRVLCGTAAF